MGSMQLKGHLRIGHTSLLLSVIGYHSGVWHVETKRWLLFVALK
jgi:hypothetical protein